MTATQAARRFASAFMLLALACAGGPLQVSGALPRRAAERIFVGGPVVTADANDTVAEGIAIADGRILAVGTRADVLAHRGAATEVVELAGRAVLPGFIDAHGHLAKVAQLGAAVNVASPPVGPVRDLAGLQAVLREHIAKNELAPGTWVLGVGYDDALLAEQRHPTRDDLDAVSTQHPIALLHVSIHLATANSAALAAAGISAATPDPPSGVFRRRAGSREPNGVMEEHAAYALMGALPQPGFEQRLDLLETAQQLYASHGFTTVQEGAMSSAEWKLLRVAAERGSLFLDVVAYAAWLEMDAITDDPAHPVGSERGRLKLGGVKLVLDGSPQGKTAWLSTPYEQPPDGQDSSYAGYAAMSDEQVAGYLRRIHAKHWPLLAHANGDAAAEQLLRVTEQVVAEQGAFDWRPVMIHAQMVRDDQLARMKPLGMIPSFFTTHTFYWGDWHRDSVMGLDRASRISPAASALRRGLHFTIHNDAPVVPPDAMRLLWAAVNRRTRSGDVIGAHERLTPMQAVRALTIEGAYQSFDAARKGSLEVGKFADLVVLSASPLEVAPDAIRNIVVLETIKEGSTVHLRD